MDATGARPGAIIIGGSFHSLGAARNLAQHGVPVCVVDRGVCVSRYSRRVRRFVKSPPLDEEGRFVDFLMGLAAEQGMEGWVIFPSTDDAVRVVAQNHARLSERYCLTLPAWDTVQCLYDKRLTQDLAEARQVPMPATMIPKDLDDLLAADLRFPLVLKPVVSKHFMAITKVKAFRADNRDELIAYYKQMLEIVEPAGIIVQELIPGGTKNLYSFGGYFKGGVPLAGLAARRVRQHPMEFGRASTCVESVELPELETLAAQLLTGIGYTGMAEVEFMYDERDARFELLEVNPRIWGWHSIAIRAGLDLPYLAYTDALGEPTGPKPSPKAAKWVRLVTDVPTVVSEVLAGRLGLRQYLASMSGNLEFAVLSLRDPLPFIADVFLAPYNYFAGRGF